MFRGPKGGLYYWHVPKTGKNAGQQVKRYLTKEEREQFNAGSDGTKVIAVILGYATHVLAKRWDGKMPELEVFSIDEDKED